MQEKLYSVCRGRGTTQIVFIHGNMASAKWWRPVMESLDEEFIMLAVDLRGYGQSPDGAQTVTLAQHAYDLHEVINSQGFSQFILVGHSLGGAVAMEFVLQYPELAAGLVLVDSAPVGGMKNIDYGRVEMMLADRNILEMALRFTLAKPVEEVYFAELLDDAYRSIPAVIPNTRALDGADFTARVKVFAKPVLVLQGEKDVIVSLADAKAAAQAFPNGRCIMIAEAGHNPQIEDPVEFARHLRDFAAGI